MNSPVTEAAFNFDTYRVKRFIFEDPDGFNELKLDLKFNVAGLYNEENGVFKLWLVFIAKKEGEQPKDDDPDDQFRSEIIFAEIEATFSFPKSTLFQAIPEYFYPNSIGIIFPYLRAFISAVTAISEGKHMRLPLYNLSALGDTLKVNTRIEKE